jgi:hypothetical protein
MPSATTWLLRMRFNFECPQNTERRADTFLPLHELECAKLLHRCIENVSRSLQIAGSSLTQLPAAERRT